jgi:hypothetical protein
MNLQREKPKNEKPHKKMYKERKEREITEATGRLCHHVG